MKKTRTDKVLLQIKVSQQWLDRLDSMLHEQASQNRTQLIKNAVAILFWIVREVDRGRIIISRDPKTSNEKELVFSNLIIPE